MLSGGFDFGLIAARTPGFAGADLQALTKEAAAAAISRIFGSLKQQKVEGDSMDVEISKVEVHYLLDESWTVPNSLICTPGAIYLLLICCGALQGALS